MNKFYYSSGEVNYVLSNPNYPPHCSKIITILAFFHTVGICLSDRDLVYSSAQGGNFSCFQWLFV